MPDFFSFINSVLWGSVMIYLLFGAGCWFTFRTGFVQFRYIRQFGKSLKNSIHPQPGGLTSFQSLCTSLAARVGSGNLAGVALAEGYLALVETYLAQEPAAFHVDLL
ncbi:alanine:cation symporter family protein, partial [Escherichia coli]